MSLMSYLGILCVVALTPTTTAVLFSMANSALQGNGSTVQSIPSDVASKPTPAYVSQTVGFFGFSTFRKSNL